MVDLRWRYWLAKGLLAVAGWLVMWSRRATRAAHRLYFGDGEHAAF